MPDSVEGMETPVSASKWRPTLITVVGVFFAVTAIFRDTGMSMVDTWYNTETYTHGFVILPIAIWLVWQKRQHLAMYTPQPSQWALLLVVAFLASWAVSKLVGVQVIEQASFVAVLISAIVALVGFQVAKLLAFPLLFLFFAVPMGEDLVPIMMEFTADFTVGALKLSGIPVYREGLWFSLPSGNWSVVEACSGVRYLIASATLGTMYAYISYHILWKRLTFIALSIVVPILANGLRAYMIVMIGHLSDMKLAVGVDHLLYGWVFFGIVMFLLFWVGSFFQDDHEVPTSAVPPTRADRAQKVRMTLYSSALLIVGLSATSAWAVERSVKPAVSLKTPLTLPSSIGEWQLDDHESTSWKSVHPATAVRRSVVYRKQGHIMQVFVAFYPTQGQGMEAISSTNKIADNITRSIVLPPPVDDGIAQVSFGKDLQITVANEEKNYQHIVRRWYRVADRSLTSRYLGKAYEALARIYPGRSDGAWIAVTTPLPVSEETAEAQALLSDFVTDFLPAIEEAIDKSLGLNTQAP